MPPLRQPSSEADRLRHDRRPKRRQVLVRHAISYVEIARKRRHEVVHVGPLSAPILPLTRRIPDFAVPFVGGASRHSTRRPSLRSMQRTQHAKSAPSRPISSSRPPGRPSPGMCQKVFPSSMHPTRPSGLSRTTIPTIEICHVPLGRLAERLERNTIARADLVLYPSEWAAEICRSGLRRRPCSGCMSSLGAPISKKRRTVVLCLDAESRVRAGSFSSVPIGKRKAQTSRSRPLPN